MKIKIYGVILASLLFLSFTLLNLKYKSIQNNPEIVENSIFYSFLFEFNNKIYDTFFKNKAERQKSDNVFLIDIDEDSVRELGRWPWSREIIATIWDNSMKNGVKVIANDIIFSEAQNKKADGRLEEVIQKYPAQIILGTFGEGLIAYGNPPYQDYCFVESFRRSGGDQIVTLNATLTFDDSNSQFEQVFFTNELKAIFDDLDRQFEQTYLSRINKKSLQDLDFYQKNSLVAEKSRNLVSFCYRWLQNDDEYLRSAGQDLLKSYNTSLDRIPEYEKLASLSAKIKKFKDDVHQLLVPQYASWPTNVSGIQSAAEYTATFNADIDFDGVIRHYPLIYRSGNKTNLSFIPSLALQAYLLATGYQAIFYPKVENNIKTINSVVIRDIENEKDVMSLPVDSNGRLIINYYGRGNSIPYVSARDLFHNDNPEIVVHLNGQPTTVNKAQWLKGKAAVMGPTATGIFDLRNTPVEKALPGVEIHLTVLGNLFDQTFMQVSQDEFKISVFVLLFLAISIIGLFLYSNLLIASLYLLVVNYGLYKVALHNFNKNLYFELLAPAVIFTFSIYIVFLIYIYFFETRKSKEIKNTFSKYVSKEIVEEILKNQENLELKGQKLKMTVFFSDIRSFTTLSEEMDPQELSSMLNKYFTPMSEIIFGMSGTIDKFMGDAIMALFGAPLNYPDHPQKACLAALRCIEKLAEVNVDFKKRNWPELKIGIGLNTGIMVAGNIGSDQIQSYTVIGDEVNLGQRVESLTKNYHAKILISENTYLEIKNEFIVREVDNVRVKGKNRAVKIYELISHGQTHTEMAFFNSYHQALQMFYTKQFNEAELAFAELLKQKPEDFLTQMYLERSTYCKENPVSETWDGVFERRKT
ncbi:MAG: adenylate/guanylate cyclase domain-containing protein [Bdellovibrionota bacterium]